MSSRTDIQDKYCGHYYDIHLIQNQNTKVAAVGRHLLWFPSSRVNVVAVCTILVLHVGVIGHHVHRQSCFMFPPRTITDHCALARARGSGEAFGPPEKQEGGSGAARPPNDPTDSDLLSKIVKK